MTTKNPPKRFNVPKNAIA